MQLLPALCQKLQRSEQIFSAWKKLESVAKSAKRRNAWMRSAGTDIRRPLIRQSASSISPMKRELKSAAISSTGVNFLKIFKVKKTFSGLFKSISDNQFEAPGPRTQPSLPQPGAPTAPRVIPLVRHVVPQPVIHMQQRTPMGAIPRMGMAGIGVPGAPGMQMGMRPPVMGMHR